MASSHDELECVICSESLVDPRALPCGHSYCGPLRNCLNYLNNDIGGLRCAICRVDHNLKAEDIKPLYGIRDFINGSSNGNCEGFLYLQCTVHQNMESTFWCNRCNTEICTSCFEGEHDGHSVRSLKNYLVEKIESQFGTPLYEGLVKSRETMRSLLELRIAELQELTSEVFPLVTTIMNNQKGMEAIDQYLNFINGETETGIATECLLLWIVSNIDLNFKSIWSFREDFEGAVTEIGKQSVSSQTEVREDDITSSSELTLEVNSVSSAQSNTMAASASESRTGQGELAECNCVLQHQPGVPKNFPICLLAGLRVSQRSPLMVEKSDDFIVFPYQFWITTRLTNHRYIRHEKVVRFIIHCCHADEGRLPWTIFQYVLTLRNGSSNGIDKVKEGIWIYPKYKKLLWHSINYSELVNPERKWIYDDDEMKLGLQLKIL